jgi:prepilin peptidase CpaA
LVLVWFAAISDGRTGRIPNYATYTAAGWGLVLNTAPLLSARLVLDGWSQTVEVGDVGFEASLLGLAICFGVMIVGYAMAGSGAGDVKLAAAIGSLVGWRIALQCLMATFIIAGASLTTWLIWARGPRAVGRALLGPLFRRLAPAHAPLPTDDDARLLAAPVPMGLFFALATTLVLFW